VNGDGPPQEGFPNAAQGHRGDVDKREPGACRALAEGRKQINIRRHGWRRIARQMRILKQPTSYPTEYEAARDTFAGDGGQKENWAQNGGKASAAEVASLSWEKGKEKRATGEGEKKGFRSQRKR